MKCYHAFCSALKGASTWGYTEEEALKNIREVVQMTVESMIEHREKIPEIPEELTKIKNNHLPICVR